MFGGHSKDPLFVVRQDYNKLTKAPLKKGDKGTYKKVDSYVFYRGYDDGKDGVHLVGFGIDDDGKLVNTTFYDIKKTDLGRLKKLIQVPEKDLKFYKHSASDDNLKPLEQLTLSRSAIGNISQTSLKTDKNKLKEEK